MTPHLSRDELIALLKSFVAYPSQQSELQEGDPAVKSFIRDCAAAHIATHDLDEKGALVIE